MDFYITVILKYVLICYIVLVPFGSIYHALSYWKPYLNGPLLMLASLSELTKSVIANKYCRRPMGWRFSYWFHTGWRLVVMAYAALLIRKYLDNDYLAFYLAAAIAEWCTQIVLLSSIRGRIHELRVRFMKNDPMAPLYWVSQSRPR